MTLQIRPHWIKGSSDGDAAPRSGRVRVGIAGLGRSGWGIHATALAALPDQFDVVAVVDGSTERRAEAESQFGCRSYTSLSDMVQDRMVELVVIATPSHLHTEHAILAMESGKDVVCEKPMTTSLVDADRMVAVSHRTGRLLTVFHNRRFDPHFIKVTEMIDSGELGRIVQIRMAIHSFGRRWDWQTLREFGGGTLNNAGPHFLDQLMAFLPSQKPEVFCHTDTALTLGDAEDHCVIMLRTPGAPLVQLEITSACALGDDNWLVMGTQGTLRGTFSHLRWRIADFSHLPERTVSREPTADRSYNSEQIKWREGEWRVPSEQATTAWTHRCFYQSLFATLRDGAPLAVSASEVRQQIAVLDTCRISGAGSSRPGSSVVAMRAVAASRT